MLTAAALALALAATPVPAAPAAPQPAEGRIVEEDVAVLRNPPSARRRGITLTRPVEEARAPLARMLRVDRYVQSRVGGSARGGEDDVDRWLRERGAPDAGAPAREAARTQLAEEKV